MRGELKGPGDRVSTIRRDAQRRRGGGEDLCCVKEDRPHPREPSASCLQQERELQKSRWEGPLEPLTSLWVREYQGFGHGEGTCRWQGWSPELLLPVLRCL